MNYFFNEDETIITPNGIRYLNKEASRKFYELYKDIIGGEYNDTLFRYDLVLKACKSVPRKMKKELNNIDKLKIEYDKLSKDNNISKKDFFYLLYSCPKIIKKKVSLNDLKKYAEELNYDLYINNINEFELYIVLCQKGFKFVLENYCENLDDLLYILEIEQELDIKSKDVDVDIIDNWIHSNKFYSNKYIKDFIDFINKIKMNKYYYSSEIYYYFDNKYDLYSLIEYKIPIEEQLKIIDTYNSKIEYLFDLSKILNKKIDDDGLVNYALFLNRKFKVDYDENSLKFFVRLKMDNKPIVLVDLLEYALNLFDLLRLLQLPIIYKLEVSSIDLDILDEWFNKHKYYSIKNREILENKFLNSLKSCPKDYYDSKAILEHIERKIAKDTVFLDDKDYKIIKKYRPVTEMKKKKLVGALLFSTGIVASLYLTIIKKEYPSKVIVNCSKTFKKYGSVNKDLKDAIDKISNLDLYFKKILTTNIGGYFIKNYFEEDEIFSNDKS